MNPHRKRKTSLKVSTGLCAGVKVRCEVRGEEGDGPRELDLQYDNLRRDSSRNRTKTSIGSVNVVFGWHHGWRLDRCGMKSGMRALKAMYLGKSL